MVTFLPEPDGSPRGTQAAQKSRKENMNGLVRFVRGVDTRVEKNVARTMAVD